MTTTRGKQKPASSQEDKWIDAKKKKPKVGEKVIVWGLPYSGKHNPNKRVLFDMMTSKMEWASGYDVRWWMPIPEPPEEEQK